MLEEVEGVMNTGKGCTMLVKCQEPHPDLGSNLLAIMLTVGLNAAICVVKFSHFSVGASASATTM